MGWLCARCGTKHYDRDEALACCKKEKHQDKVSKDYIKGFRHGVKWAVTMLKVKEYEILFDSKKAIKSLKEGR
jgi:hypothetical protein